MKIKLSPSFRKAFTMVELMVSLVLAGIVVSATFIINNRIRNGWAADYSDSEFRQLQLDFKQILHSPTRS